MKLSNIVKKKEMDLMANGIRENFIVPYEQELESYMFKHDITYHEKILAHEQLRSAFTKLGVY
jgi:hypothetical protein